MSEGTKAKIAALAGKAKHTVWKYLGAAILEEKDGVRALSLGRVSFVAAFVMAMVIWSGGDEIPMTMAAVLGALLTYIGVGRRLAQPPAPSDTSPRGPSGTHAAQERAPA